MPLILVIEQEEHVSERIQGALGAEGWAVRVVGDPAAARAVAQETAPDLVVVSTASNGGVSTLQDFARAQGGPGALALVAAGETAPAVADGSLAKPFTDEQLRVAVRRCLSRVQRAAAEQAAAEAASAGEQLTSHDLFGDLLAEVEDAAPAPPPPPSRRAVESRRETADEVDRKLEQTLSGVLATQRMPAIKPAPPAPKPAPGAPASLAGGPPAASPAAGTPAAAPAAAAAPPGTPPAAAAPGPARPEAPASPMPAAARPAARPATRSSAGDIDAMLSQTLSGLGVASKPKPRPTAPAAGAPAATPPGTTPGATPAPFPAQAASAAPAPPTVAAAPAPPAPAPAPAVAPPPPAVPVTPAAVEPASAPALSTSAPTTTARVAEAPVEEPPAVEPPREEPPVQQPPAIAPPPAPEPPRREPPSKRERRREAQRAQEAAQAPAAAAAAGAADALSTQRLEVTGPAAPPAAPSQFGQYTLLDRVALGGMAEVWKARMKGVEGFQKTVAIKKILAHLTDSVDFVTMFIDEAKLAAQLNHPHIIHIYDLGKIDDDYYIAMEYVEGKDLRSILNAARKSGSGIPVGLALLIAARLASGLDYAHRKRDFDNRELGLVHRDVSPQNVLISYEGDIKLCDFGIVKAVAKASKTQMGALKGKLQYMSPEQAWGRVVDARSDIFSLGSVLFEMLAGRRLFAGDSEISVLEAVRECRIQSLREVEPGTPEAIDAIVRRALAKDPDDRYQTAGEMQKELESVLYSMKPTPGQGELAAFMHRLFGDEAQAGHATAVTAAPPAVAAAAAAEREVPAIAPLGDFDEPDEGRRKPWLVPAAAAAAVLLAGVLWFALGRDQAIDTAALDAPAAAAAEPAAGAAAAGPAAPIAALPAGAPPVQPDLSRIEEELRVKEERLRQEFEAQRRELTQQIQQAEAVPVPSAAPPAAAARPPAAETPAPAPPPPAPAPVEERPAAVEAPAPAPPPAATEAPRPAPASPPPAAEPARPAVQEGDLVAAGSPGLVPPAFVSITKPEYPALAKRMRVEGSVVVSVLVDEAGQVADVRLVRGVSQNVGLNEAAVKAARTARYRPATVGGVRVRTWANITIPFRL